MKLVVIAALAVALAASVAAGLFGLWPELGGTGAMPKKTPQTERNDWVKETKELLAPMLSSLPSEVWAHVVQARDHQMLVQLGEDEARKRYYGTTQHSLTPKEEARVLLDISTGIDPLLLNNRQFVEKLAARIEDGNPKFLKDFNNEARARLYNNVLEDVNRDRGKAKMNKALKQWTETHGGATAP